MSSKRVLYYETLQKFWITLKKNYTCLTDFHVHLLPSRTPSRNIRHELTSQSFAWMNSMTIQLQLNFMYFTQNTNDSTMPPNQKLILKSHKTITSGCVQKPALISLTLKPKYPHLPQVQLQPLYMGRGTNQVQHAGKCS